MNLDSYIPDAIDEAIVGDALETMITLCKVNAALQERQRTCTDLTQELTKLSLQPSDSRERIRAALAASNAWKRFRGDLAKILAVLGVADAQDDTTKETTT